MSAYPRVLDYLQYGLYVHEERVDQLFLFGFIAEEAQYVMVALSPSPKETKIPCLPSNYQLTPRF